MQKITRLVSVTAVLTYALIILGAAVRVYDAGMSCPDWPMCYGQLIPFPVPAESEYTAFQVALEWGHRFLAAVVGFFMLAIAGFSYKYRKENRRLVKFVIPPFILLLIQIKLGGLTVLLSNINWSVALHLGCALLFFGSLILLRKAANQPEKRSFMEVSGTAKTLVWLLALLVFLTMLVGAMVSTSHAGGVCGGLPSCLGQWWPHEDMDQLLHMKHRVLALLTFLTVLAFFLVSRHEHHALQRSARGMKILVVTQILIGTVLVYSFGHYDWAYAGLSVFHLAWGTLVFMASVGTLSKIYMGLEGGFHASGQRETS